ncbi:hypothetical protein PVAP13_2KG021016 [Panicum virgatum]|uniref:Uncharacterized protein n=1 Tax=Panicum virgatum TaxID=38727 RepID=A0A8T0VYU1_PANVG|nr:hypothetical protein PVAP13_2KG021016 [Panicum virgatum]
MATRASSARRSRASSAHASSPPAASAAGTASATTGGIAPRRFVPTYRQLLPPGSDHAPRTGLCPRLLGGSESNADELRRQSVLNWNEAANVQAPARHPPLPPAWAPSTAAAPPASLPRAQCRSAVRQARLPPAGGRPPRRSVARRVCSKRRRSPRTATGWRPKATRRRRGGEALEHGAAPSRKRGRRPPAEARRVYARRCDLRRRRRRRRAGSARRTAPGWTVNAVHPGPYFIYRPGSSLPRPSDAFHAAGISQYQVKADRHPHSSHMAPPARFFFFFETTPARLGREEIVEDIIFLRVPPDGKSRLLPGQDSALAS